MRLIQLALEAARNVRFQPVAAIIVILVVAMTCAATLLTVGRTAASEEAVASRLEAAGSRVITITDTATPTRISATALTTGSITRSTIEAVRSANGVEKAIGFATPVDVKNPTLGEGGTIVPAWSFSGELSDTLTLSSGRSPRPNEALVSEIAARQLGLTEGVGSVRSNDGSTYPVVGTFTAISPFKDFDAGVIVVNDGSRPPATLEILTTSAAAVPKVQAAALKLIQPRDTSTLRVVSPADLARLQGSISGELLSSGRGLLLLILVIGTGLIISIVFADILMRRADLGRRRALGISRLDVVILVVLRTAYPASLGVGLGITSGLVIGSASKFKVPIDFALGVGVLALISSVLASLGPAIFAATRDPVRVLRTP